MFKKCSICRQELPLTSFGKDRHKKDGLNYRCIPCNRGYEAKRRKTNPEASRAKVKKWAAANQDKIAEYRASYRERRRELNVAWQAQNKDKVREKSQRWRARNSEKVAAYNAKYRKERAEFVAAIKKEWSLRNPDAVAAHGAKRRQCPKYRLEATIRARIHATLANGKKSGRKFSALAYSGDELVAHLERQFSKGMSWANYGEWHVDHIVPLSSFDYETPEDEDFRRAWALPNLRPLWANNNMTKGAKRLTLL